MIYFFTLRDVVIIVSSRGAGLRHTTRWWMQSFGTHASLSCISYHHHILKLQNNNNNNNNNNNKMLRKFLFFQSKN
jgi:hypothetical protein